MKTKWILLVGILSRITIALALVYYMLMIIFNPYDFYVNPESVVLPKEIYIVLFFSSLSLSIFFSISYILVTKMLVKRVIAFLFGFSNFLLLPFYEEIVFDGQNFGQIEIWFMIQTVVLAVFSLSFFFNNYSKTLTKVASIIAFILLNLVLLLAVANYLVGDLNFWIIMSRIAGNSWLVLLLVIVYKVQVNKEAEGKIF
ncbi:MAG TPA: hypothetical protein VIO64_05335 [Pseudobacteroides sp.]|uniref:hypothetical protein n=1 Tax=Pseudobacteroides sp. TaxID=1968840 RepID=UPI002F931EAF